MRYYKLYVVRDEAENGCEPIHEQIISLRDEQDAHAIAMVALEMGGSFPGVGSKALAARVMALDEDRRETRHVCEYQA